MGLLLLMNTFIAFITVLWTMAASASSMAAVTTVSKSLLCPNVSVALVSDTSDGLLVQTTGEAGNSTVHISGHHLPPECAVDSHHCNLLHSQERYLVIPAVKNLIFLDLFNVSSAPRIVPVPDAGNCSPINLFAVGSDILMACLGSSAHSLVYMHCIDFEIFLFLSGTLPPLETPLSDSLFVSHRSLPSPPQFFVIWNNHVLSYSVDLHSFLDLGEELRNCSQVLYLEVQEDDDFFTIYCEGNVSIKYRWILNDVEYHFLSEQGLLFPCPAGERAFYRDTNIFLESSNRTFSHGFPSLRLGRCEESYFAGVTNNGSLYILKFDTGVSTMIAESMCDLNDSSNSCIMSSFNRSSLVLFDFSKSSVVLVNLLDQCDQPIRESFPYPHFLRPSLMLALPSTGVHQCTTESVGIGSSDVKKKTIHGSSGGHTDVAISVIVSIVFIAACITIIIIFVVVIFKRRKSKQQKDLVERMSVMGCESTDVKVSDHEVDTDQEAVGVNREDTVDRDMDGASVISDNLIAPQPSTADHPTKPQIVAEQ